MDSRPQPMDHYARMKFKMGSTVLYNGETATITGWSTNGDAGEATTYSYQLNGGGLVNETELTEAPAPAPATTETPAATEGSS